MKTVVNKKLFFILLCLSILSILCVLPYVLTIQSEVLQQIQQPLSLIIVAQLIQSGILFSISIFFGLFFTKKIHFQLPLLEAIVENRNYQKPLKAILNISILSGAVTAVAIYAVDFLFTAQGISISTHQSLAPAWQTILASFYGGISEEILMRLFFMTFFIWISMKLLKQNQPTKVVIVISIFLAALIFGLGHLPITASITTINLVVVIRALVLNGIGGVVFGWLFWKKGLESAMIAHFTADIFLLTLLPQLLR